MAKPLLKSLLVLTSVALLAITEIISMINVANAEQPNPDHFTVELKNFTIFKGSYQTTIYDDNHLILQTKKMGIAEFLPKDHYLSLRTIDDKEVSTLNITPLGGEDQTGQYIITTATDSPLASDSYYAYIYTTIMSIKQIPALVKR